MFWWDLSSHNWIGFGVIETIINENKDDMNNSRYMSRFNFIFLAYIYFLEINQETLLLLNIHFCQSIVCCLLWKYLVQVWCKFQLASSQQAWYISGPLENMGTVGFYPLKFFGRYINPHQNRGAYYAHHIGLSPFNWQMFRQAWHFIFCCVMNFTVPASAAQNIIEGHI